MEPLIPAWFVSAFAVATVFVVMFHLGLGILPREFLWVWRRAALMLKALFAVLVAVPAVALGAGARRAFAPGLQVTVALLAVVSMPMSIVALNVIYGTAASASPLKIMQQVTVVQLLPLALGVATGRLLPRAASRIAPVIDRAWKLLLVALLVLAVIGFWRVMVAAGLSVACAAALTTPGALAVKATLLTHLVVAALTALPYALVRGWRRHPPLEMEAET